MSNTENEQVNHPSHYGGDTVYEVIKVLEAWQLNFHLGNTVKYIARAGKKSPDVIQDLEKAEFYLHRYIELLKKEKANKVFVVATPPDENLLCICGEPKWNHIGKPLGIFNKCFGFTPKGK
jgi:hypothetical protein